MKSPNITLTTRSFKVGLAAIVLFLSLALGLGAAIAEATQVRPKISPKQEILDRYIVVLRDSVDDPERAAKRMSNNHRFKLRRLWRRALKGYAARIPKPILSRLKRDPDVAFIEPDRMVYALDQTLPTGVDRIQGDLNNTANGNPVDVDIAILDTGIDLDHPDLNVMVAQSVNCATFFGGCTTGGEDGHGHGSHVAGISAARNNDIGVIGMAPGARLWAVRVLDNSASGYLSWIIDGIEWVTAHADQIEVANMSLGWQGYSAAARTAIQNSVAAGVVYVVAAGNDGQDVYGPDGAFGTGDDFCPAAYPEVAAISAFIDSDGIHGGAGETTGYGPDDTFAPFSNYSDNLVDNEIPVNSPGAAIDLLCPGVNIYSTYRNGGYAYGSGTSMASPHAAGLAALYIAANGRATDADGVYAIRQALIDNGIEQDRAEGLINGLPEENDPDGKPEKIGWAEDSDLLANDIAVVSVSSPPTVIEDNPVAIEVTVRNIGTNDVAAFTVSLKDDTGVLDLIYELDDGLASGKSEKVIFNWTPGADDIGVHTLTASHDFSDDNSENDSKSTEIEVLSSDTPTTLHVSDLDGSGARMSWWWVWRATVDIYIEDNLGEPVSAADVDIDWSDGSVDSCITNSNGMCRIIGYQWGWYNSISLEVVNVYHPDLEYNPADNDDPDPNDNSNGTRITVYRP